MPKNTNKNLNEYMHFQEYFNNYLGAWSFPHGDETLTITAVREEEMFDAQTGGKKKGLCIYTAERDLPMVLNKTNAAMIAEVTGTDVIGEWIGKKVIAGTERIKAFGKVTECIRIRPDKPKEAEIRHPATEAQKKRIRELVDGGVINLPALCKYLGINDLEGISRTDAQNVIRAKTGEVIE